jgi:Flp pilus assembly protein TadG
MEFAIVLPVFLAMLLAIVDVGRVVWANNSLANAAREAARFAIVHGGSAGTACPVGPPGPDTIIPAVSSACPHPSPSKQSIVDVARQFAFAGGTNVVVEVCYGTGCSGTTDTQLTNARGTRVTVTVRSDLNLVAGAFLGLGDYTVTGQSIMLVNH